MSRASQGRGRPAGRMERGRTRAHRAPLRPDILRTPPPSCPLAKRLGGHRRQPPPPMKLRCPVAWLWNWVPGADTRSGGARPGWSPQDSRHSGLCYGRDIRPLPQRARSERVLRASSPTCPHKRRRRGDKAAALQPMKGPGAGSRRIPSGQGGRGHGCARALGAQDWPFPEAPTGLISLAPVLAQDETDQRPEEGGDGGLHQHRDPPRGGRAQRGLQVSMPEATAPAPGAPLGCAPHKLTEVGVAGPAEAPEAPGAQREGGLAAPPQGRALPQGQRRVLGAPVGDEAALLASAGRGPGQRVSRTPVTGRAQKSTRTRQPCLSPGPGEGL